MYAAKSKNITYSYSLSDLTEEQAAIIRRSLWIAAVAKTKLCLDKNEERIALELHAHLDRAIRNEQAEN